METKFTKSTDTEHTIKLDSSLIYAVWKSGAARQGRQAWLEVGTSFVGYNAPIEITGKSTQGKNLGKITEKIRNNKFVGTMEIPANLEVGDYVYFEVKLTKNGLSGESNRIPVLPPIAVTNLSWSETEARRGEILTLSADVRNVDEETPAIVHIYEADADGANDKITSIETKVLNSKIELDWEYEYHEDIDEIPTQEEMERYGRDYNPPEYFFIVEIDGERFGTEQESGLLLFKDYIEVQANERDGSALADVEFIVHMPDGSERRERTNADGYCKVENVPPGRCTVEFPDRDGVRTGVPPR